MFKTPVSLSKQKKSSGKLNLSPISPMIEYSMGEHAKNQSSSLQTTENKKMIFSGAGIFKN